MIDDSSHSIRASRREFLSASGAAVISAGFGAAPAPAQVQSRTQSRTSYVRMNLSDPQAARALQTYQNAVAVMLNLPPTDPRNWYRNVFVHMLDCPHGNWWFLPWHRGYLGWFEQTCRELTGDRTFALPYWDWSAELIATGGQYLTIPAAFANPNIVLHPSHPNFIARFDAFREEFEKPVKDFYAGLSEHQLNELKKRPFDVSTADSFWKSAETLFFPIRRTRQTNFDGALLRQVDLIETILPALAARMFVGNESDPAGFGSGKAESHHGEADQDILEALPHNNVHNQTGGFMSDMFSPVDPLFFMHHSNIDRLWDVWTRKQQAQNDPTLPEGADLEKWRQEPFLFFVDGAGKPVSDGKAGDYATIGPFDYTYQPGSGEQVVSDVAPPRLAERRLFQATLKAEVLSFQQPPIASIAVPAALTHPAGGSAAPPLYARITIQPPDNRRGARFHVLVNPPRGVKGVDFGDPSYVNTFSFFGDHSHGHGDMVQPVSFIVPLTAAMKKLREAGRLKEGEPLQIQVVPDTPGVTLVPFQTRLESVSVGTF